MLSHTISRSMIIALMLPLLSACAPQGDCAPGEVRTCDCGVGVEGAEVCDVEGVWAQCYCPRLDPYLDAHRDGVEVCTDRWNSTNTNASATSYSVTHGCATGGESISVSFAVIGADNIEYCTAAWSDNGANRWECDRNGTGEPPTGELQRLDTDTGQWLVGSCTCNASDGAQMAELTFDLVRFREE